MLGLNHFLLRQIASNLPADSKASLASCCRYFHDAIKVDENEKKLWIIGNINGVEVLGSSGDMVILKKDNYVALITGLNGDRKKIVKEVNMIFIALESALFRNLIFSTSIKELRSVSVKPMTDFHVVRFLNYIDGQMHEHPKVDYEKKEIDYYI